MLKLQNTIVQEISKFMNWNVATLSDSDKIPQDTKYTVINWNVLTLTYKDKHSYHIKYICMKQKNQYM